MGLVDPRPTAFYGDCSDSMPSSAASEDTLEIAEAEISLGRLQDSVNLLLRGIGEDIDREGLRDTPKRVAKAWIDATEGYRQSTHSVLGNALFHEDFSSRRDNSMVVIQDVEFASTSEHTLLPFYGRCHIAYVPRNGVVLGLSKVARLAKMFARRVQNQQRFTQQLLEAFNAEVQPLGCAALVEAVHLGRQHVAQTSISAASFGCFYAQPENFMQEFVSLVGLESRCQGNSAVQLRAGDSDTQSAAPCSSSCLEASSEASSVLESRHVQECQKQAGMAAAVEAMLREVGEDPNREGLKGTPMRYVQHLLASTSGRAESIPTHPQARAEPTSLTEADCIALSFTSQCEHHLLPFQGNIQIALMPGPGGQRLTQQLAESIAREYSWQLQIQERLTHQIATRLCTELQAAGVMLLCQASHMCMVARGVEQHASSTVTVASYGIFESDHLLRRQAIHQLKTEGAHSQVS